MADTTRSIYDILAGNARRFPDKTFLHSIHQDDSITHGALFALTNRIAHYLGEAGIGANDRVLVLADNEIETVAVYLGVLRHGATVALLNAADRAHLADQVAAVAPKLVLYRDGLDVAALRAHATGTWMPLGQWQAGTGFFAALAGQPDADAGPSLARVGDHAVIVHSSGTTGRPKGAIYGHGSLVNNFDATADALALSDSDRVLEFRALSWLSTQLIGLGAALFRGATVILAERFSAFRYFDWLRSSEATVGICVPVGINLLLERDADIRSRDLPHLRFMTSSSAPLSVAHWRRFEKTFGVTVAQLYGVSEGGCIAGSHRGNRRIGSAGRPMKYQDVRILDGDGRALGVGEAGEIAVADGKQQADAFLHPDGRLERRPAGPWRTGDLGFLDGDGYLHITGRLKDMVIRAGVNVAPAEIDDVLIAHPGIADAATVGVPDPVYGEALVCYVAPRSGRRLDAGHVLAHCRERLPKAKVPDAVTVVDALPRNARGKVDRNALVEEWRRTEGGPGRSA